MKLAIAFPESSALHDANNLYRFSIDFLQKVEKILLPEK
jgi:hypothetical protein